MRRNRGRGGASKKKVEENKVSSSVFEESALDIYCHGGEGMYSPTEEIPVFKGTNDITRCKTCGREHWTHTKEWKDTTLTSSQPKRDSELLLQEKQQKVIHPVEVDSNGLSAYDKYKKGLFDIYCHGGEGEYYPGENPPVFKTGHDVTECVTCGREHWTHLSRPPEVIDLEKKTNSTQQRTEETRSCLVQPTKKLSTRRRVATVSSTTTTTNGDEGEQHSPKRLKTASSAVVVINKSECNPTNDPQPAVVVPQTRLLKCIISGVRKIHFMKGVGVSVGDILGFIEESHVDAERSDIERELTQFVHDGMLRLHDTLYFPL